MTVKLPHTSIDPESSFGVAELVLPARNWRFWIIFLAVCLATLLVAIDVSIIFTALPTIANDLDSQELFVWVANAYLLASTGVQPIFGQMANIFGRRSLTIISVLVFMLGSGLAGGANSTTMMIVARTVQGIGGGGIITLGEIIVCDLVPLIERGQYMGLIAGTYAIGTVIGPVLGGVLTERVTWRWIFYLNLPISGAALALMIPFLSLKRIDWIGDGLLVAACTSILLALAWTGTTHPWSSWNIIVPLILGFLSLLAFGVIQYSGYVADPTMPPKLFSNRTTISIFVMAFVHGLLLSYVTYFVPVYFQAVLGSSPTRSGVAVLPLATTIAPAAVVAGVVVTLTGHYRAFHFVGFALMAAGCGSLATLTERSDTGTWVGFQLLFGLGNGIVINTMMPPLLASLPTPEVATGTATWTFMRSFGSIWGIAIPSAIFNHRINLLVAGRLSGAPNVAALLVNGNAYQKATAAFIKSLQSSSIRETVVGIYVAALRTVWYASIPFAVIGIPIALLVKSYDLTSELKTEFGMEEKGDKTARTGV